MNKQCPYTWSHKYSAQSSCKWPMKIDRGSKKQYLKSGFMSTQNGTHSLSIYIYYMSWHCQYHATCTLVVSFLKRVLSRMNRYPLPCKYCLSVRNRTPHAIPWCNESVAWYTLRMQALDFRCLFYLPIYKCDNVRDMWLIIFNNIPFDVINSQCPNFNGTLRIGHAFQL